MSDDSSSRIAESLRSWILTAAPGAKLPSTRALVAKHSASPVTVQAALRALAAAGLVETRPGVGTFVRPGRAVRPHDFGWQTAALGAPGNRATVPTALQSPSGDALALHSGYPDRTLLPEKLVRSAMTRVARTDAVLLRPPTAGLPDLRAWFAGELAASTPTGVTPPSAKDVVVIPGIQGGLSTTFRALVGAGAPLLIESPTYWGAILAAEQVGVRVVPIPTGVDGPDPDELSRAFERTGARAFYGQPTFASPTGSQWTAARSDEVLEIVRRHRGFLIEDDSAHDFGISSEPRPLAARDDGGHVVYLRGMTKSVSPSVRVAAIIARGPALERLLADVGAESMYVSAALQAVALDVVTQSAWRTHLRRVRTELAERRDLLADSLRRFAPETRLDALPSGGLNLWLRLPSEANAERVARECRAEGVVVGAGHDYFPAEPTGQYLRLSYGGPDPASFPQAARTIGRAAG